MVPLLLFLHVMGAIIVFGPSFSFPLITRQLQAHPENGHFAALVMDAIERRVIVPGAIVQGITGVLLILAMQIDLTSATYRWLIAGIVLYLIAIVFAVVVQVPTVARMVELTRQSPGPGGPSPELLATAKKAQLGGTVLGILVVVIVVLMVVKPAG